MFKLSAVVLLALAMCVKADPTRQRPLGRKLSARQQLQPTPSSGGYPAAGITPEIPFELPTETERPNVVFPDNATPQPDEVYGPPEEQPVEPSIVIPQPDEIYGPPEGEPDGVYGPPEIANIPEIVREIAEDIDDEVNDVIEDLNEVDEEVIINGDGAVISVSSSYEKPARLVYQRFPQIRQPPKLVPARFTNAKILNPANLIYTARFQNFPRNNL